MGRAAKSKKADDDSGGGSADCGVDISAINDLLATEFEDIPSDLYEEIYIQVQPALAAMMAKEEAKLRETLQSKQKTTFENAEKSVQERYERLALGLRALELTKLHDTPLYQHLLRDTITEPLHVMLALRYEEALGTSIEVTASTRKQCLDKIIAKEGAAKLEHLSKLLAVLLGKPLGKDSKDTGKKEKGAKDK